MFLVWNIIADSIGSMLLGIVTSLAVVALVLFLATRLSGRWLTPLSGIVALLLFLFLSFHLSLMFGAMSLRSACDEAESYITALIGSGDRSTDVIDTQSIKSAIADKYPMLREQLDNIDIPALDGSPKSTDGLETQIQAASSIPKSIVSSYRNSLSDYILRRALWLAGFLVVGTVGIVMTMEKKRRSLHRNYSYSSSRNSNPDDDF